MLSSKSGDLHSSHQQWLIGFFDMERNGVHISVGVQSQVGSSSLTPVGGEREEEGREKESKREREKETERERERERETERERERERELMFPPWSDG